MSAPKVDWLKLEREYVEGAESCRQIAARYCISERSVAGHAADRQWSQKRKQYRDEQRQRIGQPDRPPVTNDLHLLDESIARLDSAVKSGEVQPRSLEGCAMAMVKLIQVREELRWKYLTVEGIAHHCIEAGISPIVFIEKLKELYESQLDEGAEQPPEYRPVGSAIGSAVPRIGSAVPRIGSTVWDDDEPED